MSRRDALMVAAPLALAGVSVLPPIGLTLCPFALITGIACPGCGMTRAVGQLMRGDLTAAMTFHPLVVPMMALGLGAWVWYLLWRLGRVGPVGHKLVQMTVAVSFGALVLVWALRLGSGGLPPV